MCFSGTNQKPERRRPFGTGLVRPCPQGLFSLFFTFLRALFSARLDFPSPPLSAPRSPRMVITKTKRGLCFRNYEKTPKFTVKFDLKRGGKNPTEDNLTD